MKNDFIDRFIPSRDTRAYLHSIHHEFTDLEKATIVANHRMISNAEKVKWLTAFADEVADEVLKSRILNTVSEIEASEWEGNDCITELFDFVYIPHDFRHGDIVRGLCHDFRTEPYQETVGILLNYFDEDYECYRNRGSRGGDYSDVQVCVDIKFDGVAYQGEFHHKHINPIYIERLKLQEDDERQVYLDYLRNVYIRKHYDKKYSPDQRQNAPAGHGNAQKPEYADGPQDVLEQKYLGNCLPVYDPESGNWCVQTGHGFEYGPLDYVAAEFSGAGLIYHFRRNGQEDHVHGFEAVLACLLDAEGNLEPVTDYGEYSQQELDMIEGIKRAYALVRQRRRPMTLEELQAAQDGGNQ